MAQRLRHFIGYLPSICSNANYATIRESMERIGGHSITDWVKRWLERFDRLPHPVPITDDPELVVLGTGAAMVAAGKHRYANCLATMCARVALGRSLFVAYQPADGTEGLIAELLRVGEQWHLHQMHARGNRRVRSGVAATLRAKLARHGILILGQAPHDAEVLHAVAQLAGHYTYADEDIGGFALYEAETEFPEPETAEEVVAGLLEAAE
jgi:hypothetical protein